jgi:hypothetical protein
MNLEPLTPADFQRLNPFFKHQPYRLCAYSLPSIIVWKNEEYQPYAMVRDKALIISTEFTHHRENRHLLLPVAPATEYSPEALHDLALSVGHERYWFVPEDYIQRFGEKRLKPLFIIEPHPEYDDYVYHRQDLVDLSGNKYSKKRNLIKQFHREYVDSNRVQVEPATATEAEEYAEFIEAWCEERQCDADGQIDLACEKQAALNTIWYMNELEVNGLLLRIDGTVCAFGIGSYLTDEMGVLHFEKAFSRVKGLYQYFDNQCARRLFQGYRYINKESDMGEVNLAKAKRSYHPAMMIPSYKLTLRG